MKHTLRRYCVIFSLVLGLATLISAQVSDSSSPTLQITAPVNGSIFAPGQTFLVSVTSSESKAFKTVIVVPENPFSFGEVQMPLPSSTSYTVPSQIVCGPYAFTAMGITTSAKQVMSVPVSIDVERPDVPTSLRLASPEDIHFSAPGETSPVLLMASFADGSSLEVTHSTYVAYSSENRHVTTIDANGIATAVSPGKASVRVTYNAADKRVSIGIPVTVDTPSLNPSQYSVLFGLQAIGTTSSPQNVTLTNLTQAPLTVIRLSTTGDFSETDDCLSASPLLAGGTCVVNLTFKPTKTGARSGQLEIFNGQDVLPTAVFLTGTGQ